jgi:hypothetical protein
MKKSHLTVICQAQSQGHLKKASCLPARSGLQFSPLFHTASGRHTDTCSSSNSNA